MTILTDLFTEEHVRPRFGKRSITDDDAELEKRTGLLESVMLGNQALRDYVKHLAKMQKINNPWRMKDMF